MPMEWLSELTGNTISLTVERDMRQTQVLASGTAVYKNKKKDSPGEKALADSSAT